MDKCYIVKYLSYDVIKYVEVYASNPAEAVDKAWKNELIPREDIAGVYECCSSKLWYKGW